MIRLTKRVDGRVVENHDHDATPEQFREGYKFRNGYTACLERLAAYEDTDLTPQELRELLERAFPAEDGEEDEWWDE
ncbi:MAG: hypothetical protein LBS45_12260 [Synergistaceae bacterium]|jgi:hypothetical protein|nr:hypothetical protein [Synergistaceae bacterium]